MPETTSIRLVSWNVAGWSKTLQEIRRHGCSLKQYMDRHEIDILCLQEVKGNLAKLESSEAQAVFAAKEPGLDSFFSLCTSTTAGLGFNGVCTFARCGLTQSANPKPFDVPELDTQGRCIVTDHGSFVLFNVYVPYDGGARYQKLEQKMRFLNHLLACMRTWAKHKPVVLAGDLNMKHRAQDVYVGARRLDLAAHVLLPSPSESTSGWPRIALKLRSALSVEHGNGGLAALKKAVRELECEPFGDNGKFRVFARHPITRERKRINPGELWTQAEVDAYAPLQPVTANNQYVGSNEDTVCLADLRVLTEQLLDVPWTDQDYAELGEWWPHLFAGAWCTHQWIKALCGGEEADGEGEGDDLRMRDSFLQVHGPNVQERFTCWNTRTNERYSNSGSRIDYVLVDQRLAIEQAASAPPTRLYGCDCEGEGIGCVNFKRCGLQASTAFGVWRPAPREGGGLPQIATSEFNLHFGGGGGAGTGILYTPPTCSDHVAVSCVLLVDKTEDGTIKLDTKDANTKLARPYAKQLSLAQFGFGSTNNKRAKSDS